MPARYAVLATLGVAASLAPLVVDLVLGRPFHPPQDLLIFPFSAVYVAGLIATWRRPAAPVARRLLANGTFLTLGASIGNAISLVYLYFGVVPWLWLANAAMQASLLLGAAFAVQLFATFPDGRYQRAYERWAVRAHFLLPPLLPVILLVGLPELQVDTFMVWARPSATSPVFTAAAEPIAAPVSAYVDARFLFLPASALLLALRYRRLAPEQKQMAKWPLAALTALTVLPAVKLAVDAGLAPTDLLQLTFVALFLLLPTSLAISVMRHRLLDIDVVIRRSVLFAALTALVSTVYLAVAATLGVAVGQRLPFGAAVLVTVAAALALQPLRRRLEGFADAAGRLEAVRIQSQRIVQAQETERRRIERNIHDGVQQEIVALIAKLRLARNQLARDAGLAEGTLAELQDEAGQMLEDLRELAKGIHPAVLSDRGLVEAIEARAGRLPIGVTIEASPDLRAARFPEAVEGAAYFVVSEGLANILKHSGAGRACVKLERSPARLTVEVSDRGRGFDPETGRGSGLTGLRDRIEALGGRLSVQSERRSGTILRAELPIAEPQHA